MIDIHHHLLWGLDDGAADEETSVEMARLAADDGITHVVCTPHANARYRYDRHENEARVDALRALLAGAGVAMTLGLGCDFHMNYENLQAAIGDPARFSINGSRYLLVELPDFGIPVNIGESFLQLQEAGLRLILTHPERNATLVADPKRMVEWLRNGMMVQVTADSVTGRMGKTAQRFADQLLAKRWVQFVASDAHNLSSRPPRMREARELIEQRYGSGYAAALCQGNPRAVFYDEPLGAQEEPVGIGAAEEKGWLGRLLRR